MSRLLFAVGLLLAFSTQADAQAKSASITVGATIVRSFAAPEIEFTGSAANVAAGENRTSGTEVVVSTVSTSTLPSAAGAVLVRPENGGAVWTPSRGGAAPAEPTTRRISRVVAVIA